MRPLRLGLLWHLPGAAAVVLLIYLSLANLGGPQAALPVDKITHFAYYLLLAFWFGCVYRPRWFWLLALVLLATGGALELAQSLTPNRRLEAMDMLANALGIGAGLVLAARSPGMTLVRVERYMLTESAGRS